MTHFPDELLVSAHRVLDQHSTTSFMVRLLPEERRHIFALTYSYFRWLDDEIDDGSLDAAQQSILLERAHSMVRDGNVVAPNIHEQELLAVLGYAERNGLPFRVPIEQMTVAIELDSKRVGKIPTETELHQLQDLRVLAYLNALRLCTNGPLFENGVPSYGIACDEIHMLRDLREDFSKGIFNFSQEEVQHLSLDLRDLDHTSWRSWRDMRHKRAGEWLARGYAELVKVPSRYYIMCWFNLSRYGTRWLRL